MKYQHVVYVDAEDATPQAAASPASQSKLESLIETCLNVLIGFCISFSAWPVVASIFDLPYSTAQNLGITGIFTALSITRGYVVRRFFNQRLHSAAQKLAKGLR